MSDHLQEFVWDAREHLATAQNQLLELEQDPSSLERLNALMGTLHTIKGNCGFVNLRHLYDLLHAAESLLQTVRETGRDCPRPVVDSLFQVLDTAEAIMGRLDNDEDDEVDWMPSLMEALADVCRSLEAGGDGSPPVQESAGSQGDAARPAPGGNVAPARTEAPGGDVRPGPGGSSGAAGTAGVPGTSGSPSPGPNGGSATPPGPASAILTVSLTDGRIEEEGEGYLVGPADLPGNGAGGLILDMRKITALTAPEAKVFRLLRDRWGMRMAVVASRENQADLCRILDVFEPESFRSLYPAEDAARVALLNG
ncbi:MAG: Hpt domain-containing protein [Deltaproteobacteria bacterium]|nr:Hpt domain-containing protein [Deltaproteobacteria bacterium]